MIQKQEIRAAALVAFVSLFAGSLVAQNVQVSGTVLQHGTTVRVTIDDPSRAGQTVTLLIQDPSAPQQQDQIAVTLNASGQGSCSWVVQPWRWASFTVAGSGPTLPCTP